MEFSFQFQNLSHFKAKRAVFFMGLILIIHLSLQSLVLPYGNVIRSLMLYGKEDIDLKLTDAERVVTNGVVLDDERNNNSIITHVKDVADNVATDGVGTTEKGSPMKEMTESLQLEKSLPENNHNSSGDQSELKGGQMSNIIGSHETDSDLHATKLGLGHEDLVTEDITLNDSEVENRVSSEEEIELPHDNLDTERKTSTVKPPNSVITE